MLPLAWGAAVEFTARPAVLKKTELPLCQHLTVGSGQCLAVGETVILLHPLLHVPLVIVSIWLKRER